MKCLIKTLIIFFLFSSFSFAQWQMCGPYGGRVLSLASCDSLVFAGTYGGGIYVTLDSGTTWTRSGLNTRHVTAIHVKPYKIYAGCTAQGVYKSIDKGNTWTQTSLNTFHVYDIYEYSGKLLAATEYGVYLSEDYGGTWTATAFNWTYPNAVLVTDSAYFTCSNAYIYRSTTNGATWSQVLSGGAHSLGKHYTAIVAGTYEGFYISNDDGDNWTYAGHPHLDVWDFSTNGQYAGTDTGVYMTIDGGASWSKIGLQEMRVNAVEFSGGLVFAGTQDYGIYVSGSMGGEWTQTDFPFCSVFSYAECDNKIFAGVDWSRGIYFSSDTGKTWTQTELNNKYVYALTVKDDNIYAGTGESGVYISTNKGVNWTQTSLNDKTINKLVIKENYIFASTHLNGLYRSTNSGTDWELNEFSGKNVYALATIGDSVFAGVAAEGIYLSTNNGTTWYQTSLNNRIIHSLAVNGNNIFAGTKYGGVFISTNGGADWFQSSLNTGIVNSLLIDGNNLFAGTDGGVFLSTNDGSSWVAVDTGLTYPDVASLFIHKSYLFAGTNNNSGWRRPLSEMMTSVEKEEILPSEFSLCQNYPNPFNPSTTISYNLASGSNVILKVYDILGREVAMLVNEYKQAGKYEVEFNASSLASGVYFYQIKTGDKTDIKKMVLLR